MNEAFPGQTEKICQEAYDSKQDYVILRNVESDDDDEFQDTIC